MVTERRCPLERFDIKSSMSMCMYKPCLGLVELCKAFLFSVVVRRVGSFRPAVIFPVTFMKQDVLASSVDYEQSSPFVLLEPLDEPRDSMLR